MSESLTMNNARTAYVKWLPLIVLTGLLMSGILLYLEYYLPSTKPPQPFEWRLSEIILVTIKYAGLWIITGLAFNKMREALIALGVFAILYVINHYVTDL